MFIRSNPGILPCGMPALIHSQDLEIFQASSFFPHRKLVKAELRFLNSAYIMHLKLTLVSVLPPAPSSQAQFTEARRRPLGLLEKWGWSNTKRSSEPTVIYVSRESQIGMRTGHIVFFLEQHVIKEIFLQLEKWGKVKSQSLQKAGEEYLVRKSCDCPLSSATVACEGIKSIYGKSFLF